MYFKNVASSINKYVSSKEFRVDTGSRVGYSLVTGALIDYYKGGLTGWGIVGSRISATGLNTITSRAYGRWQDGWYALLKTVPETRKFKEVFNDKKISTYIHKEKFREVAQYSGRRGKQFLTDMLSFNTFEPFVYGASNIIGQFVLYLIADHDINLHDTLEGMKFLVEISPVIAPTMRLTMQGARKVFGIKTSAELTEEKLKSKERLEDIVSNT